MTRAQKAALAAATIVVAGIVAGVVITIPQPPIPTVSLEGAVLRQDADPRRQMPIENAAVTAAVGSVIAEVKSDASGFFRITLHPAEKGEQSAVLTFHASGYHPLNMVEPVTTQIVIARMVPMTSSARVEPVSANVVIANLRLRYSIKATTTANVGSVAKTFEVANTGGIPCNGHPPCSPDGRWKASKGSTSLDAGQGNEFVDVRRSCIAGPCPFTSTEINETAEAGRTLSVTALDWSDTATFLVEAEVTHLMLTELIRESYPVIFGNGMNFTLPANAEGPSIEAEVNGADIVFPLGPDLWLSWATCTVKVEGDRSKLYRCELKPGYRFQ